MFFLGKIMKKLNFLFLISLIVASQVSFASGRRPCSLNFGAAFGSFLSGENTGAATPAPPRTAEADDRVPLSPSSPNTLAQSSSGEKKKSYRLKKVVRKKILNPRRTAERRAELARQRIRGNLIKIPDFSRVLNY